MFEKIDMSGNTVRKTDHFWQFFNELLVSQNVNVSEDDDETLMQNFHPLCL